MARRFAKSDGFEFLHPSPRSTAAPIPHFHCSAQDRWTHLTCSMILFAPFRITKRCLAEPSTPRSALTRLLTSQKAKRLCSLVTTGVVPAKHGLEEEQGCLTSYKLVTPGRLLPRDGVHVRSALNRCGRIFADVAMRGNVINEEKDIYGGKRSSMGIAPQ